MTGSDDRSSVVLRDARDEQGSRYLKASIAASGDLCIEGQDLGESVERFFGSGHREYEWGWAVRASDVPRLMVALKVSRLEFLLLELKSRFEGDRAGNLQSFLLENEIPFQSWSRVGD